jgi:hypothetical protein
MSLLDTNVETRTNNEQDTSSTTNTVSSHRLQVSTTHGNDHESNMTQEPHNLQTMKEFIQYQTHMTQTFVSTQIAKATQDLHRTIEQLKQENHSLKQNIQNQTDDIDSHRNEISKLKSELSKIGNLYHETRLKYEKKKKTMATFLDTLPFQIDEDGQIILKTKMNMTSANMYTTEESQYPLDVMQWLQIQNQQDATHDDTSNEEHVHESSRPRVEYCDNASHKKDSTMEKPRRVTLDANTIRKNHRKDSHSSSEETDETNYVRQQRDSSKEIDVGHTNKNNLDSNVSSVLSPPLSHISVKQEESQVQKQQKQQQQEQQPEESFLESASAFNPNFELNVESGSSQSEEEDMHHDNDVDGRLKSTREPVDHHDPKPSPIQSSIRSVTPMTQRKVVANYNVPTLQKSYKRPMMDDNNMAESADSLKGTAKRSKLKLHQSASLPSSDTAALKNHTDALKQNSSSFKYKEVVRGKTARVALKGFDCEQCGGFFNAVLEGKGSEIYNRDDLICKCSRHRSKWSPDKTPKDFWEMSFADSIAARENDGSGINVEETHDVHGLDKDSSIKTI